MRYDIEVNIIGYWIKVSETRFRLSAVIQAWSWSDVGPTRVVDTR